jgi:hypothetical protein
MPEIRQRIQRRRDLQDHIPAAPTVAAIRPASWNVLLAVEVNHSIAAFARPDVNFCFVNKHNSLLVIRYSLFVTRSIVTRHSLLADNQRQHRRRRLTTNNGSRQTNHE